MLDKSRVSGIINPALASDARAANEIAGLCKGSTTDSDSVCEGSNPSPAAKTKPWNLNGSRVFIFLSD